MVAWQFCRFIPVPTGEIPQFKCCVGVTYRTPASHLKSDVDVVFEFSRRREKPEPSGPRISDMLMQVWRIGYVLRRLETHPRPANPATIRGRDAGSGMGEGGVDMLTLNELKMLFNPGVGAVWPHVGQVDAELHTEIRPLATTYGLARLVPVMLVARSMVRKSSSAVNPSK